MNVIRYSQAFKMQAVRDVETGGSCAESVQRKYNIKGKGTVLRWVRHWGSGKYGKIIRVEKGDEISEGARLRSQLRRAKEALADTHMELALEKAFLAVACEQMDQTVESFKKSTVARRAPGGPNPPGDERDLAVQAGADDAAKLLRAAERAEPAGG